MAYDPATGQYTEEDSSVANKLTGLLASNSPYLKGADAPALRAAGRRGLQNSSIAVQAGEAARIDKALPVAQQDAAQAATSNNLGRQLQEGSVEQVRGLGASKEQQEAAIAAGKEQQATQIGSTEKLAGQSIEAQQAAQERELAAAKESQATGITAQKELQGTQLAAAKESQATDIAAKQALQASEQANQQWLAQFDATTRTNLQQLDEATKAQMQQLDIASQQRIADLNVASDQRDSASRLAASLELGYMQSITAIQNNPDIPADVRQTYLDHANAVRDSNLALIEQMYGITLDWGQPKP